LDVDVCLPSSPHAHRVLTELVSKMRDMQMDKTELGCLRAIVLFNPDSKGLSNPAEVEALREKVYASLEAYCKHKYPEQPGRFAKLLLRLPALRSIGLKCLEHLFFFKLIGDTPIDTFLMEMLELDTPRPHPARPAALDHSGAQEGALWGLALGSPGCPTPSQKPPASPPPASCVTRPMASWGRAPLLLLGCCHRNVLAVFEKAGLPRPRNEDDCVSGGFGLADPPGQVLETTPHSLLRGGPGWAQPERPARA
ncbi:PREDICTED: hepatocyte nuclear factor 4-alpha-like, partial [Bison bison bison]|uniref:Hepatocyte nuclear factor 4-alpha-like n=1 Tax=Bison bison bison TaxID=43346 RepID=A0A6P3HFR8_BISBB